MMFFLHITYHVRILLLLLRYFLQTRAKPSELAATANANQSGVVCLQLIQSTLSSHLDNKVT